MKIFGKHDEATIRQITTCLEADEGARAVLCADGHKGYAHPIGGVVAYKNKISISGVGFDIACGTLAARTDAKAKGIRKDIERITDAIQENISFGIGRHNKDRDVDHEIFDDPTWTEVKVLASFKDEARTQLGTVGSGNHFVDILIDEEDRVWVGLHFGSRGFGHKVTSHFLKKAGGKDGMDVPPTLLEVNSKLGQDYLQALMLAGRYAYIGREWVVNKVVRKILKAKMIESIHNHHNFAWNEIHDGEEYWVVRKGATPAFPGQRGFVGGSMGDPGAIVEGVDSEESKNALYSTVHGAGRILSRSKAAGKWKKHKIKGRKTRVREGGIVTRSMMRSWLVEKGVCLRGGDLDESPHCYRRLRNVLKLHEGTIKILHTLTPIGVVMAGDNIFDPYKD